MNRPDPARPVQTARPARLARSPLAWLFAASCVAGLAGCGGGGSTAGDIPPAGGGGGNTPVNADARLLASNCFQCHGTNGSGGFESIRGDEAGEVREYRNLGQAPANRDIMAAHAQGYTDEQITLIVRHLQQ
jgi:hypothetical protein